MLDVPAQGSDDGDDREPFMTDALIVRRSTKRDGLKNRLEGWALSHLGPMWHVMQAVDPIERVVNRALINAACEKAPPRPYALSTRDDYTSWTSLTDRDYSARQLPPVKRDSLPDAESVAQLFERGPRMVECPKSTVLFAYFAQWFTDGFLRSKRPPDSAPGQPRDLRFNESNPEVDLTPLYGHDPAMTKALREGEGGRLKFERIGDEEYPPLLCDRNGAVKEEFKSIEVIGMSRLDIEQRRTLLAMGSDAANGHIGYATINILFLREHNRIARELERKHSDWDDERLFQTTRCILTVVLLKLTIEEYINHIAPYEFQFKFDPRGFDRAAWYRPNRVVAEFNLLYRWHPLIPDTLRVHGEDLPIAATLFGNELIKRHGLGEMFDTASHQRAGKVGLFNTAGWFHDKTTLRSIGQARALDLAPYNDYREDCQFPRVTDFDQISSDVRVRDALRKVYGTVDGIEFYIGLFAEDARPNSVLPSLLGRMVGVHAFSQLMTNPLLAPAVYNEATFSREGMEMIKSTNCLADVLHRNVPAAARGCQARLTREGWKRA